eukprot:scaffold1307_cov200-Pinguiococcus_pyrenoidosus.AAC.12
MGIDPKPGTATARKPPRARTSLSKSLRYLLGSGFTRGPELRLLCELLLDPMLSRLSCVRFICSPQAVANAPLEPQ